MPGAIFRVFLTLGIERNPLQYKVFQLRLARAANFQRRHESSGHPSSTTNPLMRPASITGTTAKAMVVAHWACSGKSCAWR